MAERRMFAKTIIDSDAFLDMPVSAQALYFHLGMRADDDGFVNSPKKIMKMVSSSEDDLKLLCAKKFIIPFEDGVVVIKHWRIHNYIRKDTYNQTPYKDDLSSLEVDENNCYRLRPVDGPSTSSQRSVNEPSTQDRLGKDRLVYNNILVQKSTHKPDIFDDFATLWKLYPRREGKNKAFNAYSKAIKDGVPNEDIEAGIKAYVEYIKANKIEAQFVKMGSTWFNQRCWQDDYSARNNPESKWGNPEEYKNWDRNDSDKEIPF